MYYLQAVHFIFKWNIILLALGGSSFSFWPFDGGNDKTNSIHASFVDSGVSESAKAKTHRERRETDSLELEDIPPGTVRELYSSRKQAPPKWII